MENREPSNISTTVRRLCGHCSGGPSGVPAQSTAARSRLTSPSPPKTSVTPDPPTTTSRSRSTVSPWSPLRLAVSLGRAPLLRGEPRDRLAQPPQPSRQVGGDEVLPTVQPAEGEGTVAGGVRLDGQGAQPGLGRRAGLQVAEHLRRRAERLDQAAAPPGPGGGGQVLGVAGAPAGAPRGGAQPRPARGRGGLAPPGAGFLGPPAPPPHHPGRHGSPPPPRPRATPPP